MYPLAGLPDAVRDMVVFSAVVEAFRDAVDGHPSPTTPDSCSSRLAWLALAFALASRGYRFTDDRHRGGRRLARP